MREILRFILEGNPAKLIQFNPRYGALVVTEKISLDDINIEEELFGEPKEPKNVMKIFTIKLVKFDENSELGYVVLDDETNESFVFNITSDELSVRLRRMDTMVNTGRANEVRKHLCEFDPVNDSAFFQKYKYVCYKPPYAKVQKEKKVVKEEDSSHSSAKDVKKK